MQRRIVGFHPDEEGDFVAELDCLHQQHVRHKPPFMNRPWVTTKSGRTEQLDTEIECSPCDRFELPTGLVPYKKTPEYSSEIPKGLLKDHTTQTWARLCVLQGQLVFTSSLGMKNVSVGESQVIAPQMKHAIRQDSDDPLWFYVEFLS